MEHNGGYNIDWSEWDSESTQATGYKIVTNELIYKTFYKDGVRQYDYELSNIYEDCQFADGEWGCEGPLTSNNFIHWNGQPTHVRELANGQDITEWSSSLEGPGVLVADSNMHRWSGDETDPNNEPEIASLTS